MTKVISTGSKWKNDALSIDVMATNEGLTESLRQNISRENERFETPSNFEEGVKIVELNCPNGYEMNGFAKELKVTNTVQLRKD